MNNVISRFVKTSLLLSALIGTSAYSYNVDTSEFPQTSGSNPIPLNAQGDVMLAFSANEPTKSWGNVAKESTVLNTVIIPSVVGMVVGGVSEATGASKFIRNAMQNDAGVPLAVALVLAINHYADKWAEEMHKDLRTPESTKLIRKIIACAGLAAGIKLAK